MKFQNHSMHGSWRTDGRTHNPKPICPVKFFEVGDIIKGWSEGGIQENMLVWERASKKRGCYDLTEGIQEKRLL